jgi:2-polyprenyl-3-methyl-5-hydroxy-6-metoxy-1,4-benzoquinol methylase
MDAQTHWQEVYTRKPAQETSWYCAHLSTSLALIDALSLEPSAPVIDVGAGRSTLADDLLTRGLRDITVLDIAEAALADTRARLGDTALHYVVANVLDTMLPEAHYALWHDRAVFHFLTEPTQRGAYVAQCARAVSVGGHAVLATFALDGPAQCSQLSVCRYDIDALAQVFAPHFALVRGLRETHRTPWGSEQPFTYALLRRV